MRFRVVFLLTCGFAASALLAAHRFLRAATIAALPALLSLRLGFGGSGVISSDCVFDAAHRFLCASAIRARPAALIPRRLPLEGAAAGAAEPVTPDSIPRSSAICSSIPCFLRLEAVDRSDDDLISKHSCHIYFVPFSIFKIILTHSVIYPPKFPS